MTNHETDHVLKDLEGVYPWVTVEKHLGYGGAQLVPTGIPTTGL